MTVIVGSMVALGGALLGGGFALCLARAYERSSRWTFRRRTR